MRRATIVLCLAALMTGSCGGHDLPTRFATTLRDRVASIRLAAEEGRPGDARSRLNELVAVVTTRLDRGRIDEGRALEILASADAVAIQLSLLPRPSPTKEAPSPSPVQDEEDKHEGKGKGKDKGHGND
jgi:hypothetical protein